MRFLVLLTAILAVSHGTFIDESYKQNAVDTAKRIVENVKLAAEDLKISASQKKDEAVEAIKAAVNTKVNVLNGIRDTKIRILGDVLAAKKAQIEKIKSVKDSLVEKLKNVSIAPLVIKKIQAHNQEIDGPFSFQQWANKPIISDLINFISGAFAKIGDINEKKYENFKKLISNKLPFHLPPRPQAFDEEIYTPDDEFPLDPVDEFTTTTSSSPDESPANFSTTEASSGIPPAPTLPALPYKPPAAVGIPGTSYGVPIYAP